MMLMEGMRPICLATYFTSINLAMMRRPKLSGHMNALKQWGPLGSWDPDFVKGSFTLKGGLGKCRYSRLGLAYRLLQCISRDHDLAPMYQSGKGYRATSLTLGGFE